MVEKSFSSVELGFTDLSPAGLMGGEIVPASCPSNPHTGTVFACSNPACVANYGASCSGGTNVCGKTGGSGTIQCDGRCGTSQSDSYSTWTNSSASDTCNGDSTTEFTCPSGANGICVDNVTESECTRVARGGGSCDRNGCTPIIYETTCKTLSSKTRQVSCTTGYSPVIVSDSSCPAPIADLRVNNSDAPTIPWSDRPGGSWTSENARSCDYYDVTNGNRLLGGNLGTSGTIKPANGYTQNTTHKIICKNNANQTGSDTVAITVLPRPVASISASPENIISRNGKTSISWSSTNSIRCGINKIANGRNSTWQSSLPPNSTTPIEDSINTHTVYSIICYNEVGGASEQKTVTVSYGANPKPECDDGIDNDLDNLKDLSDPDCTSKTDKLEARTTSPFITGGGGSGGSGTGGSGSGGVGIPPIQIDVNPKLISPNEQVTISWLLQNSVSSCDLYNKSANRRLSRNIERTGSGAGSYKAAISKNTVFQIICRNPTTQSAQITARTELVAEQ